jgi:hypothetical protein
MGKMDKRNMTYIFNKKKKKKKKINKKVVLGSGCLVIRRGCNICVLHMYNGAIRTSTTRDFKLFKFKRRLTPIRFEYDGVYLSSISLFLLLLLLLLLLFGSVADNFWRRGDVSFSFSVSLSSAAPPSSNNWLCHPCKAHT